MRDGNFDAASQDEHGRRYDPARSESPLTLDDEPVTPAWLPADTEPPDPRMYVESEQFVAGALSTMPPFNVMHPAWALPFARQALDALSEWVPKATRSAEAGDTDG
jgi:hypothetical protein